jgi:acetyl-CoA carboxylase biotin carboxyl carrier protein
MELKQIKELMTAMERAGMKRISIKEKTGFELELERQDEVCPHQAASYHATPIAHPHKESEYPRMHSTPHHPSAREGKGDAKKEEKVDGKHVSSPMVGTFYSSPSPDDPAFVKVGDRVDEHTVVCIIEAMKVMNEVKAGMSGTVAEVLADNAQPVEFGTKLFRIV